MSLDKLPMAVSSRTSRKSLKDRMIGVSVKLENLLDNQYGQMEKWNSMASAGKSKRMSLGESEKDSGFQVAGVMAGVEFLQPRNLLQKNADSMNTSSEYLSTVEQTDLEDRSSHKRPAALSHAERITAAHSSLPSLTPVYIVKNVFLKEPLPVPSRSQFVQAQLQAWGSQQTLGTPGQARVVFIRQPLAASFKSQKAEAKAGVGIDTYLPILNSYPRIAPHPHKGQDAGSRPTQAGHCLAQDDRTTDHSKSKRLCLGEAEPARNEQTSPVANSEPPDTHQPPSFGAANLFSQFDSVSPSPVLSPNPASPSESSESLHSWPSYSSCSSSSSTPPPSSSSSISFTPSVFSRAPSAQSPTGDATRPAARASRPIPSPAKERRFRNTVEILSRSGLLQITLKTKDLIRQNNSAQRQIDELKEHVQLFCSAMQSKEPQALLSLQEVMKGSGSYRSMSSGVSSSSHL